MHFILIFGPPAVGKMTVGNALSELTQIPLFHNHMSIEPALRFFPFGSPSFARFVKTFRQTLFEEAIASQLNGLIFTYVWNLDSERDIRFVQETCELFRSGGAKITLVELKAELDERLFRNKTEARLQEKPSKRDVAASEARLLKADEVYTLNTTDSLPLDYDHIVIDNTHMAPLEVAQQIESHLLQLA